MRPMALVVGIGFVLTLLGGVVFAIKLYRVGITVKEAKGIAKTVTTQPLSCFRSILRRSPQDQVAATGQPAKTAQTTLGPGHCGGRSSTCTQYGCETSCRQSYKMIEQASNTGNTWTGRPDDKDQESTAAPHPKYWSWRRLESPAETPVRKIVANSQASCQVHGRCHRIRLIHPIQLHTLPKGDQTGVY